MSPTDDGTARLPLPGLLTLAGAGFVTILTETLPAGLLPQIAGDLATSPAMTGQMVTIYAVGSLLAAIPLTAKTQGWRRRPLLVSAIAGFALVNTVTAISTDYTITMIARFFAGVSAGLLWALLAGYATRMVPARLAGRAIAIAMIGTPLALSIGVPAGTWLGNLGWRVSFGIMSVFALALIAMIFFKVPDFPGHTDAQRRPLGKVFAIKGMATVLIVTLGFVLAHNLLYTYIVAFLDAANMADQTDRILLAFGIAALGGIWVIGVLIDRWHSALTFGSIIVFGGAALVFAVGQGQPILVYGGVIAWGLAFGGAATLFQTASAKLAGPGADVAQSMIVTAWNLAIAGGGLIGGLILSGSGAHMLPWSVLVLLVASFVFARTGPAFRDL